MLRSLDDITRAIVPLDHLPSGRMRTHQRVLLAVRPPAAYEAQRPVLLLEAPPRRPGDRSRAKSTVELRVKRPVRRASGTCTKAWRKPTRAPGATSPERPQRQEASSRTAAACHERIRG